MDNNIKQQEDKITFKNVEFSDKEKEIFCNLIRRHPADTLPEFIFDILKDKALLFFEMFQDENIKIQSFEELKNNIIDAKIYAFFEKENILDKDPYGALARWLGMSRKNAIRKINDIKIKLGEYNCLSFEKAIQWDKERKRFFRKRKKEEEELKLKQTQKKDGQLKLF